MSFRFTNPNDWRPRGIDALEPAAWTALRHSGSTSVVAGPGAGKTEFLAQKATYLLETGLCRPPFQILAISFKGDAAANLAGRVRQRCPPEFADRFVSMTFDAFTKGLVDRFRSAIPAPWRPTKPYEIVFPAYKATDYWLADARLSAPSEWQAEIANFGPSSFEGRIVGARRMEVPQPDPTSGADFATQRWWGDQLAADPTKLTFVTLNRMAELLLRSNPQIANALRATYPFVFVDEFQDTTFAQYDFLYSVFKDHGAVITGVGDDKQRIMGWAGARPDAFARLETDFGALRVPLLFNFRSSPDLVAIQHVVARALDKASPQVEAKSLKLLDGDVAQVWNSRTCDGENRYLAAWLVNDMRLRGREPRDYAILVKQKADVIDTEIREVMSANGLRVRNESAQVGKIPLQDLLSDNFCRLVVAALRLGSVRRAPAAWQRLSAAVSALRGVAPGDGEADARAERELTQFLAGVRARMSATAPTASAAVDLAEAIISFLDVAAIQRTYVEYGTGDLLELTVEALLVHLMASAKGVANWVECLDAFEGIGQIPLMTVHKSKGLEYDTIIFMGLDDHSWWSHNPGDLEGLSTFFVALSRAKQRAIFAFCQQRGQRARVAELYALLEEAGVPEIPIA